MLKNEDWFYFELDIPNENAKKILHWVESPDPAANSSQAPPFWIVNDVKKSLSQAKCWGMLTIMV